MKKAAKKRAPAKRARRPSLAPGAVLLERMRGELEALLMQKNLRDERCTRALERAAGALEVLAQYAADYATRDRVQRLFNKVTVNPPEAPRVG